MDDTQRSAVVFDELYDLKQDPGDSHNLYGFEEYAQVIAGLHKQLLACFPRT